MAVKIDLNINGRPQALQAEPSRSLLSVLRDDLLLTGCKYGCGEGECGACTVLIDGQATRSCITPVSDCTGKRITTIEGLEQNGQLHPLQSAFIELNAMQCGYCTTGMIMNGVALLAEKPRPSRDDIVKGMNGNVCRCCTYPRIVAAIERAAETAKAGAQ